MTLIEIYNVPNVTPKGFIDKILTEEVPILDDSQYEDILQTDDRIDLKADNTFQVRDIQRTYFKKYKLSFYESTDYYSELIKASSGVFIRQEGFRTHEAKGISVTRELNGQALYKTTIEYYDISDYTVAEFLKSEWLKNGDSKYQTWNLFYSDGADDYIATRINPDTLFPEFEISTVDINDIDVATKSLQNETAKLVFFCSRVEALKLQQNTYKYLLKLENYPDSIELTQPTIEKLNGEDIYKIEIEYLYNKLKYYQ